MFDVIIIGGGWSGIFTLKHCLEQKLNVICLEQSSEYGLMIIFDCTQNKRNSSFYLASFF